MSQGKNSAQHKALKRQTLWVLAFVLTVTGAYLVALYVHEASVVRNANEVPLVGIIGSTTAQTEDPPFFVSRATPKTLSIPALGIRAEFETSLTVDEHGETEVPVGYDTVGWYRHSPTPGEMGPAIVLGHVDSKEGPAVFYSLGQLVPGDSIEIERNDGSTVVFDVTGLERVEQDTFPTERVYGNINHAGIRLITCSGTYDKKAQRYSHNLIVYGVLRGISTGQ